VEYTINSVEIDNINCNCPIELDSSGLLYYEFVYNNKFKKIYFRYEPISELVNIDDNFFMEIKITEYHNNRTRKGIMMLYKNN
jgi:hypothetical protein